MFLTLEDPRARVKGSRDPLGVQPVWASFGRALVTNLTTVTTSVRGFTTLLLGRWWAERLVESGAVREHEVLPLFLRMEQVAAYARHVHEDRTGGILGIQRVQRFLAERGAKVVIDTTADGLILSDQKTYGLWGLYTVSARASGLVADGPFGLTPRARAFVDRVYAPALAKEESRLRRLVLRGGTLDTGRNRPLMKALAAVYRPALAPDEVAFFGDAMRDAREVRVEKDPDAPARQRRFARMLVERADLDADLSREEFEALAAAARSTDDGIAVALDRILRLEALLAPAERIFGHLQARPGHAPAEVAATLRHRWGAGGVPHLAPERRADLAERIGRAVSPELTAAMLQCDEALAGGDYETAVRALLQWNELVMAARQAAPWVRLRGDVLDVRYRGIETELPDGDELPGLWRNTYFIDALKAITRQLEAAA